MGVFNSKEVESKHTKRDVVTDTDTDTVCVPGFTLYSTTCNGPPVSTIAACVSGVTTDICDNVLVNGEACAFSRSRPLDHACLVLQRSTVYYFKGCLAKNLVTIVMMTMIHYLFRL